MRHLAAEQDRLILAFSWLSISLAAVAMIAIDAQVLLVGRWSQLYLYRVYRHPPAGAKHRTWAVPVCTLVLGW